jgi:hypothetical protein
MAPETSGDDRSEDVDTEKLSDEYPPDEPLASEDYGVTGAEQRYDEPLEEQLRRQRPEGSEADDEQSQRVVQPIDQGVPDEEEDLVAEVVEDPEVRDRPPGDEITGDETTRDVGTERVSPPAEETALHIEEET